MNNDDYEKMVERVKEKLQEMPEEQVMQASGICTTLSLSMEELNEILKKHDTDLKVLLKMSVFGLLLTHTKTTDEALNVLETIRKDIILADKDIIR